MDVSSDLQKHRLSVLSCFSAYVIWGLFPIYFNLLENTSADEVVVHRVLWSMFFAIMILFWNGKLKELRRQFRDWRGLGASFLAGVLIAGNWTIFVWAVMRGHILETSIGYYISSIANILLGVLFFNERLSGIKKIAFFLCFLGLVHKITLHHTFPFVAILLATTFSGYSVLKKRLRTDVVVSFASEMLLISPLALGYWIYLIMLGGSIISTMGATEFGGIPLPSIWGDELLLMGSGAVTLTPILLYTFSIKHIHLSLAGFLQYLTPSLSFLVAILIYEEAFSQKDLLTFIPIWLSLLLCSFEKRLERILRFL